MQPIRGENAIQRKVCYLWPIRADYITFDQYEGSMNYRRPIRGENISCDQSDGSTYCTVVPATHQRYYLRPIRLEYVLPLTNPRGVYNIHYLWPIRGEYIACNHQREVCITCNQSEGSIHYLRPITGKQIAFDQWEDSVYYQRPIREQCAIPETNQRRVCITNQSGVICRRVRVHNNQRDERDV